MSFVFLPLFVLILQADLISGGSTIEDTNALFVNTLKRWNIEIRSAAERKERYKHLIAAKRSVDRTTTEIELRSLNRYAVNSNAENDKLMDKVKRSGLNFTDHQSEARHSMKSKSRIQKRHAHEIPLRFDYWELTVGLVEVDDQLNCGSCWVFPATAALEAVYKWISGEDVNFSEQYFVDCTFPFSGCEGGSANDAYDVTMMRQFIPSAEQDAYIADYQGCSDQILDWMHENKNNKMAKMWLQDWVPMQNDELAITENVPYSPVTIGTNVGMDLVSYSGGVYEDVDCVTNPIPHALLLIGYTENTLRLRNSWGAHWGESGYINFKRASSYLEACGFFKHAYGFTATHRREMKYSFCNSAKLSTWGQCHDSCLAMNKEGETGWNLATIPTRMHNQHIMDMIEEKYPGKKTDAKFRFLWIGLLDLDMSSSESGHQWIDNYTPFNYLNVSRIFWEHPARYGTIDKNTGEWNMKNSLTFLARGLCSRAVTCWDIENVADNGLFSYDNTERTEGTVATLKCHKGYFVVGDPTAQCIGGVWGGQINFEKDELPECSSIEPTEAPPLPLEPEHVTEKYSPVINDKLEEKFENEIEEEIQEQTEEEKQEGKEKKERERKEREDRERKEREDRERKEREEKEKEEREGKEKKETTDEEQSECYSIRVEKRRAACLAAEKNLGKEEDVDPCMTIENASRRRKCQQGKGSEKVTKKKGGQTKKKGQVD